MPKKEGSRQVEARVWEVIVEKYFVNLLLLWVRDSLPQSGVTVISKVI